MRSRAQVQPPLRLERRIIELHLRHAWTTARNSSSVKHNVLVRLAHGGCCGLGEAAPNVRYHEDAASVLDDLERVAPLLGDDPRRIDEILDAVQMAVPGRPAALAAVDIALHDLLGRMQGVPLHRLLGTHPTLAPPTSFSIGIDAIPVMQEKIGLAAGFGILKIKVGLEDDRALLEGVRAVTDKPLYVDANEGWKDPARAIEIIRWMEGIGVVLVEQPLPAADLDGAKRVRDAVSMPIFADEAALTEADLPPLAQAFDGVNVKLQKAGGIRGARRMIDRARQLGMKVMIGCMIETSLGITAASHLASLADHADLDGHLLLASDPFRGARLQDGRLVPPDRPGLGIEGDF